MKILLTTLNAKYIHTNLAIRLLYQLNKKDERLHWKEFTIKQDADEVAEKCSQYDVVAFSCYIWNITQTLAVAEKIKSIRPHIKVLLGGPEVSYEWDDIIIKPQVDFIITGEGEIPFEAFLKNYPEISLVPNLVYKENDLPVFNEQPVQFDLQKLENIMPYADDDADDLKNLVLYVESSRGCPYKCGFCLASLDNKVRQLPMNSIRNTIMYLMEHGRTIKFLDRTFNVRKDFTIDIFEFILKHHRPENIFQFEITADIVHPDIIKFIDDHVPEGLFRFEIGIQTVNQKANLEVGRKQNFEKTKQVIHQLKNKIELHLDLIAGLPFDYLSDVKNSFEEVLALHPPELQLGFLKFLKGTPVRKNYLEHGYEFDPIAPYQMIRSKYLSSEELNKILILENGLEIYWNKKRCISALKYVMTKYSSFDFMAGLANYFKARSDFHKHSLTDVYTIIYDFVLENYSHDELILQLIVAEYCLHHRLIPKAIFKEMIQGEAKREILQAAQLNENNCRFAVIAVSYDIEKFITTNEIVKTEGFAFVRFKGEGNPDLFFKSTQELYPTFDLQEI